MAAFLSELFGLGPQNRYTRQPRSRNDRMEDGFLVVGETSEERSTLQPGQGLHIDRPPSYDNAQVPVNYHNPFRQPQPQYPGAQTSAYINYMNNVSSPSLQSGRDTVLPTYREAQGMPSWRTNHERITSLGQSDEAVATNHLSHEFNADSSSWSIVAGIPFKLSPVLESSLSLNKVDGALTLPCSNMRDFEYNFTLELQILQEYEM